MFGWLLAYLFTSVSIGAFLLFIKRVWLRYALLVVVPPVALEVFFFRPLREEYFTVQVLHLMIIATGISMLISLVVMGFAAPYVDKQHHVGFREKLKALREERKGKLV